MNYKLLIILLLFTTYGCNSSAKNNKLVEAISNTMEANDYTVIYIGAHWCGPCSTVFEDKMSKIIDSNYENIGCVTIFFDAVGKIKNNENIMKYSPVILPSIGGIVDKMTANNILKEVFQDYESVNYMPIMILSDKEGNIINCMEGRYYQFDTKYLDTVIFEN